MSKYVNIGYESIAELIDDSVKRLYWINYGANFELEKKNGKYKMIMKEVHVFQHMESMELVRGVNVQQN